MFHATLLKKAVLIAMLAALLSVIIFASFYWCSSYDALKHWYLSKDDCFFFKELWVNDFFLPGVKTKGNKLAAAGALIAASGILYILWNWRRYTAAIVAAEHDQARYSWLCSALVFSGALVLGRWESHLILPVHDEIFSAVNYSAKSIFHTLTLYTSPNNHMLFNIANRVLFYWVTDKVATGRLLSLLAYAGTMVCIFRWLLQLTGNCIAALLALVPIALQFTTIGFSAVGRGYELQLLCGWLAFISLFDYIKTGETSALRKNSVFNLLGFMLIPSYTYFFLAQVFFYGMLKLSKMQIDWKYCKHQLGLVAALFLFYLPGFCCSGVAAFTKNRYVQPMAADAISFFPKLIETSKSFVHYCFSYFGGDGNPVNYVLFFLPALLFLSRKRDNKLIAAFYCCLWIAYLLWSLKMRYHPYQRTLTIQFSFAMVCLVYTLYVMIAAATNWIKNNTLKTALRLVCYGLPVLLFSKQLFSYNRNNVAFMLYGYNVNGMYNRSASQLWLIPVGSSISCSSESYYLYYHLKKHGYNASQCFSGNEDYYVRSFDDHDPLPFEKTGNYTFFTDGISDFVVYKRKP